jgi:hypothetical protein
MKLFLVRCGFYDGEVFDDARAKARLNPKRSSGSETNG